MNPVRFSGFIIALTAMKHDTKYEVGFGNMTLYDVSGRLTRYSFMAQ